MSKWNFANNGTGKPADKTYTSTLGGANKTNTTTTSYGNTTYGYDDKKYEDWWSTYKNCHTANNAIFTIGEGTLFAGGWTRGAKPETGWYVLDLSEHYALNTSTGKGFERTLAELNKGYLVNVVSLYIKDFDVPTWTQEFWLALAADVKDVLTAGTNILVACDGGHGRTGLVLSILCHLLGQCNGSDPIDYVRKLYCINAVETIKQEQYVYDICGLAAPVHDKYAASHQICCVCGEKLYASLGDDMEAEVCEPCISRYGMTKADLEKMALDSGKVVDDLKDAVEGEVKELDYAELNDCLGTCGFCGANLDETDAVDYNLCESCYHWALDNGMPLN